MIMSEEKSKRPAELLLLVFIDKDSVLCQYLILNVMLSVKAQNFASCYKIMQLGLIDQPSCFKPFP